MTTHSAKLTRREEAFCRIYAHSRDPDKAAKEAGLSSSQAKQLLFHPAAAARIQQHAAVRQRRMMEEALAKSLETLCLTPDTDLGGLIRLSQQCRSGEAFSEPMKVPNVSEVKLTRDGAIELKFFDRGKLLEALLPLARQEPRPGSELIDALENSVCAPNGDASGKE